MKGPMKAQNSPTAQRRLVPERGRRPSATAASVLGRSFKGMKPRAAAAAGHRCPFSIAELESPVPDANPCACPGTEHSIGPFSRRTMSALPRHPTVRSARTARLVAAGPVALLALAVVLAAGLAGAAQAPPADGS